METEKFDAIFPMGGKNEAFAPYFVGQSYLHMLTTGGVGTRGIAITGILQRFGICEVIPAGRDCGSRFRRRLVIGSETGTTPGLCVAA